MARIDADGRERALDSPRQIAARGSQLAEVRHVLPSGEPRVESFVVEQSADLSSPFERSSC